MIQATLYRWNLSIELFLLYGSIFCGEFQLLPAIWKGQDTNSEGQILNVPNIPLGLFSRLKKSKVAYNIQLQEVGAWVSASMSICHPADKRVPLAYNVCPLTSRVWLSLACNSLECSFSRCNASSASLAALSAYTKHTTVTGCKHDWWWYHDDTLYIPTFRKNSWRKKKGPSREHWNTQHTTIISDDSKMWAKKEPSFTYYQCSGWNWNYRNSGYCVSH